MTEPRHDSELTRKLEDDLHALRESTSRNLPELTTAVATIRSRRLAEAHGWKEGFMSMAQGLRRRPWLASGLVGAALVVAALVIPVSYDRVTGHRVTLTVEGAREVGQIHGIAEQLESLLHVDHVAVRATQKDGVTRLAFEASVPAASHTNAPAVAQAFAKGLVERGYAASAIAAPIRERVSGSVYAYAVDRVIRVSVDGKTAVQIEAEIKRRLTEAGITNATVSVTDLGDHKRKVTVEAHHDGNSSQAPEPGNLQVELTKDGRPLGGEGVRVEVRKLKSSSGVTLHLSVTNAGKTASVDIPSSEALSDAALASAIERQLREAGLDLKVTVTNGRIAIDTP